MIFDDFHGFSRISSFLRIVLNASRRQMASKRVHFHAFATDLISFRMKIHETSFSRVTGAHLNLSLKMKKESEKRKEEEEREIKGEREERRRSGKENGK